MSAIAGIYHLNDEPTNIEHGKRMMKDLEKYPADDIQTWHNDKVFFGCHAQWITPESVGEKLPYYDRERKLSITADAIIDNREELFEKLQIKKSKQKSITDSELILLSYDKWEEDAPKYLVGDFAFMIWDGRKQQLFGARDLLGYRTLYYFQNKSVFTFCSIIKPLLSLPYIKRQLNELWLAEYLAISGMIDTVDALSTPYKNIEQVPPSHSILIAKGNIKLTKYGTLYSGEKLKLRSNQEYIEAFQDVFQQAVTSRLRTFRNVGAQLSGGLDSGAVVGFAGKALQTENKTLHTFSYIPPKDFVDFTPKRLLADERPFIKSTVDFVGNINDHYLDFEGKNSYTEIDDMLGVNEIPYKFFENSFWLKGMFDGAKQEGIGVLLNGDGGNFTVSWGDALEFYSILLKRFKWIRLFHELDSYCRNVGGARLRRLPVIFRVGFPVIDRLFPKGAPFKLPKIINQDFADKSGIYDKLLKYGFDETGWFTSLNVNEERRAFFEDIFIWNAGNTLNSKLSLQHSLWKRDPTNDIRVIQFCLSVPGEQFVQNGVDRALIRRATEHYLPDKVRLNQKIRGVQGVDWVHRMKAHWNTFIDELQQLRADKSILEYFDIQVINSAISKAMDGPSPEYATDADLKVLMRSLIVYRFIKRFT
jgi:asparagine synthase (glutamine-hydrolysing)